MLLEIYDALGQIKKNDAPPEYLLGDEIGYQSSVANISSASIAAGAHTTAFFALTIIGDGVNATMLEFFGYSPYISAGTNGNFEIGIYDTNINDASRLGVAQATGVVGNTTGHGDCRARLAPFTGTKTVYLAFKNASGGVQTITNQAGPNNPSYFRAVRLKGANVVGLPSASVTAPLVSGAAQMAGGGDVAISSWQTVEWDNTGGKMFKVATPNVLFAPESGIYSASLVLAFAAGTSSTACLYCYAQHYNAAGVLLANRLVNTSMWAVAAATSWVGGSIELNMVAGDFVVFAGAQFTGGTRAFASTQCRFQLTKKAPNNIAQYEQTDTGWIPITPQNSWTLYAGYSTSYRRKNGIVYCKGLITGGVTTPGTTMFTLPVGFRPASPLHMAIVAYELFGSLRVDADGTVDYLNGNSGWYSLDNIRFVAEQ